jgi:hypothetical protein
MPESLVFAGVLRPQTPKIRQLFPPSDPFIKYNTS